MLIGPSMAQFGPADEMDILKEMKTDRASKAKMEWAQQVIASAGKSIQRAYDGFAREMSDLEQDARFVEDAWGKHDVDELVRTGYLRKGTTKISEYEGERLNVAVRDIRRSVDDARNEMKSLEKAWENWDLKWFQRNGYFSGGTIKDMKKAFEVIEKHEQGK